MWKKINWLWLTPVVLLAQTQPAPLQHYFFRNVQIVGGGFIPGIVMHPLQPGLMYARTDIGGAYRWNQFTSTWIPLVDWVDKNDWNYTGIESIGLDPNDPSRLYLACGTYIESFASNGAIFRSTDRGATFKITPMPFKMGGNDDGRFAGERLAVDPANGRNLYFGSRTAGLWTSSDYGATWSAVASLPASASTNSIGLVFVTFDNSGGPDGSSPETIYVGASDPNIGLYSSSDHGASWQAVAGQPTGLLPNHGVIDAKGNLYLTYGDQPGPNNMTKGAVWKYSTWTQTWTDITPVKPTSNIPLGYGSVALDAMNPGTLMVATMDRWSIGDDIYRSKDGGATWTGIKARSARDDSPSPWITFGAAASSFGWWIGNISIDPFNPDHVVYTTGATIWGTHDATAIDGGNSINWAPVAQGLEETAVLDLISPSSGANLISAVGDIGGFRHDDLTVSPPAGMFTNPVFTSTSSLDFAELKPSMVVRAGSANGSARRAAISMDGGASWTPVANEPQGSQGSGTIAIAADGSRIVWTPQSNGAVSVSIDQGATWTFSGGISFGTRVVADRVNPLKFYGFDAGKARIVMSSDGGRTFLPQTPKPVAANNPFLRAAPGIEGDLWLVASSVLYHSTDGGVTLNKVSTLDEVDSIGFGKAAVAGGYPALYMIGTVGGSKQIYRSDDMAATWTQINDERHQYSTSGVIIGDPRIYGRVYIGNNGRGVIYGDIAPLRNPVPERGTGGVMKNSGVNP